MRIGINALYLLPGKVGGSETYIRNLVKWLPLAEGRNSYAGFVNNESRGVFKESSRHQRREPAEAYPVGADKATH